MIKCLIFDCDGTLVDSEHLCNLGLEIKLRDYGLELSADELLLRFRGVKLSTIFEAIELENNIKLKDDFVASYRALVETLFKQSLKACDGVKSALTDITLAKCVASSGPPKKIENALSITGLIDFFDGKLFSSYDVGSWKPEPDLFIYAAKEMGYNAHECAVVEDSEVGIEAAKSAGMRAILYDPNGIHDDNLCTRRIKHMRELNNEIK